MTKTLSRSSTAFSSQTATNWISDSSTLDNTMPLCSSSWHTAINDYRRLAYLKKGRLANSMTFCAQHRQLTPARDCLPSSPLGGAIGVSVPGQAGSGTASSLQLSPCWSLHYSNSPNHPFPHPLWKHTHGHLPTHLPPVTELTRENIQDIEDYPTSTPPSIPFLSSIGHGQLHVLSLSLHGLCCQVIRVLTDSRVQTNHGEAEHCTTELQLTSRL